MTRLVPLVFILLLQIGAVAQAPLPPFPADRVLTHRDQAAHVSRWISDRFDSVLPALMRREGIGMWIVVSREYNDDPVFRSMSPLTTFSSRRRTILVFFDQGDKGVERLSIDLLLPVAEYVTLAGGPAVAQPCLQDLADKGRIVDHLGVAHLSFPFWTPIDLSGPPGTGSGGAARDPG